MSSSKNKELSGPDLKAGADFHSLKDNTPLVGHVDGEAVLLVRQGEQVFAIGATCTHYAGPLAEGLIIGDTVRCPWHHARFSLRTGEAVGAPALNPVSCWNVRREGGRLRVGPRAEPPTPARAASAAGAAVVIVGGGPAGAACAEM